MFSGGSYSEFPNYCKAIRRLKYTACYQAVFINLIQKDYEN